MTQTTNVTVDDSSTRIIYKGSWIRGGNAPEYNSTTHGTQTAGSQATFVFNGSSISVYGTIGFEESSDPLFAPVSTYSIDGSDPVTFTGTPQKTILYRQLYYQSPRLEGGRPHTLTITNTLSNTNPFWLDFVEVGHDETTSPAVVGATSSVNSKPTDTSDTKSGITPGAIAGAAIGGTLALLLLLIIIIVLFLRRHSESTGSVYRGNAPTSSRSAFQLRRKPVPAFTPFNVLAETALLDTDDPHRRDSRAYTDVNFPETSQYTRLNTNINVPSQLGYGHGYGYHTQGNTPLYKLPMARESMASTHSASARESRSSGLLPHASDVHTARPIQGPVIQSQEDAPPAYHNIHDPSNRSLGNQAGRLDEKRRGIR